MPSTPTTWFTSDLHLGHPFVAELRGFSNVEEHDRQILDGVTAAVKPGDVLWVLGDISSGWGPQEDRALELLDATFTSIRSAFNSDRGNEAPGGIHLISGNHDSCHPIHLEAFTAQRKFLEVFDSVQSAQKLEWSGREVWLNHFPRPGFDHEGMSSRHDEIRLSAPHIVHGHLHSSHPIVGPGLVDVGLDAWELKPVAQDKVNDQLLASLPTHENS